MTMKRAAALLVYGAFLRPVEAYSQPHRTILVPFAAGSDGDAVAAGIAAQ